jgi:predicted transcriptional regulator
MSESKFTVTKKPLYEDKSIILTLRIDKKLKEEYDAWATRTNRSRNELMCMALAYALQNIELTDENAE